MRIAFVDYILDPRMPGRSGLSDVVWDMASKLADMGHESHIVASYHSSKVPDQRVRLHQFQTPPMGYRNVFGNLWLLGRTASILRNLQLDVIHCPEYLSTGVMSALGINVPIVLTVPGNIYQRLGVSRGSSYEWHYAQVLKWAARRSARRCARVIAISADMKFWWEKTGTPEVRIALIPLGVNPSIFFPVQSARSKLGIGRERVVLSYVGRFAVEKGLVDLLTAVKRVSDEAPTSNLIVYLIGGGPMEGELRDTIVKLNLGERVVMIPWVQKEELRVWYSASDAVVLPSYSEGLSRTIPEAMMCGTPIIGSRISGTEDHVTDGETGYLFEAGNVKQLSRVLSCMSGDTRPLNSMRTTVRRYAQRRLAWDSVMERIVNEIYVPVIEARQRSR